MILHFVAVAKCRILLGRLVQRRIILSPQRPLVFDAANGRFPPFVLHMPRYAAPCTNVVEGLQATVRRACHERQVSAESRYRANNSGLYYSRAPKEARRRFVDDHRDELLELLGQDAPSESDEITKPDAKIVPFSSQRMG